jgi:hypothetical protein
MSNDIVNGSATPQPPTAAPQMQLNGQQLAAMLVIEGLLQHMQTCVNQLGAFVGYKHAAELVAHAGSVLGRDYEAMKQQWGRQVQIASPDVVKSIIPSKG